MVSGILVAEYQDGFVISDIDNDVSEFCEGKNVFHDIEACHYVPIHGDLIKLSLITPDETYDIDWTIVPHNARPVRRKQMQRQSVNGVWTSDPECLAIEFGYEYLNYETNEFVRDLVTV